MRIAVYSTCVANRSNAANLLMIALVRRLTAEGHIVRLSVPVEHEIDDQIRELQDRGLAELRCPHIHIKRHLFLSAVANKLRTKLLRTWRSIQAFATDFLMINEGGAYTAMRDPIVRRLISTGVPYGILLHQESDCAFFLDGESRREAQEFYEAARFVCFLSGGNRRAMERKLAMTIKNATFITNPLKPPRTPLSWPIEEEVRWATVGRLAVHDKGQDLLFEALSSDSWRVRDYRLSLYGLGTDHSYLKDLAQYFGIDRKVRFMGWEPDILKIWRENHMLVLPSRTEGNSVALMEALGCGRPAIVTPAGGGSDWIDEGTTGYMADGYSVDSIRCALERAWQSRPRWQQMGEAAYESVQRRHDFAPDRTLLNLIRSEVSSIALDPANDPQAVGANQ